MLSIDPGDDVPDQLDTLEEEYMQISEEDAEAIYVATYDRLTEISETILPSAEEVELAELTDVAVVVLQEALESEAESPDYLTAEDFYEEIANISRIDFHMFHMYAYPDRADLL